MSESVLPLFSSRSLIVSGLTFRSLIHFEFIFVCGVRKCSIFILLQVTKGGCEIPEALRGKKDYKTQPPCSCISWVFNSGRLDYLGGRCDGER